MSIFGGIVDSIHAKLNDATVKKLLGRKALSEHQQQRRIVWIRRPSPVVNPQNVGGKLTASTTQRTRTAYVIEQAIEANIYAESEDTLEVLVGNLLAAISLVLGPRAQKMVVDWETETDAPGVAKGHLVRGCKALLLLSIAVPVTDEIAELVTIEEQGHDGNFENAQGTTIEQVC
jgi:hypothetical protein